MDPDALRLERKRLLLEIQISPTQTTILHEKEVGKNDVIELFDQLDGVTDLAFHRIIYDNTDLLNLLETQKIPNLVANVGLIPFNDAELEFKFRTFVSPYLAAAYAKASVSVLRTGDYLSLLRTSHFFRFLTQSDAYLAFRNIENYCNILEENLQHFTRKSVTYNSEDYRFLYYSPFYDLVNKLSDYFEHLPSTVGAAIINFTVSNQQKIGRGNYLITLSDQARRLHCTAELKSILINNREAFWNSREQKTSFDPNKVWRVLVIGLILFIGILRIAMKNDSPNIISVQQQQANLEELRKQFNERKVISSKTLPSKDESFLQDVHAETLSAVQRGEYAYSKMASVAVPKLIPTFESYDPKKPVLSSSLVQIQNNTSAEIVMILMDDSKFISRHLHKFETIEFPLGSNASVFFYSGNKWYNDETIAYDRSGLNGEFMYLNGRFINIDEKNIELLRRFYSLRDEPTTELLIEEKEGQYEFYQNGVMVNYSY